MREFFPYFKIDNKAILAPDQDLAVSKQDLDAEGSGRDELGYMHRIVLRERVCKWDIKYAKLSEYEFEYMNDILEGKKDFEIKIRKGSKEIITKGYCSGVNYLLHNAVSGIYKNVSYSIVEC
jgi:hypothetical protein